MAELRIPWLADEVVLLRRSRETDVAAQLEAFSDPLSQRFSDWAPHTEAGARAYLAEHEQARQAGKDIVGSGADVALNQLDEQDPREPARVQPLCSRHRVRPAGDVR